MRASADSTDMGNRHSIPSPYGTGQEEGICYVGRLNECADLQVDEMNKKIGARGSKGDQVRFSTYDCEV